MARLMIVDDSAVSRKVLCENLKQRGHEIAGEAGDGEAALMVYDKVRPDLVTLDLSMPGMDGLECLRRLIAKDPAAKVLVISAQGTEHMHEVAKEAGCAGYIVKPFDWVDLYETLEGILK